MIPSSSLVTLTIAPNYSVPNLLSHVHAGLSGNGKRLRCSLQWMLGRIIRVNIMVRLMKTILLVGAQVVVRPSTPVATFTARGRVATWRNRSRLKKTSASIYPWRYGSFSHKIAHWLWFQVFEIATWVKDPRTLRIGTNVLTMFLERLSSPKTRVSRPFNEWRSRLLQYGLP